MLSYTSLHWGTEPLYNDEATCAVGNAESIGKLKACSYAAVKAGEPDIYRHVFEGDTHLLKLAENGKYTLKDCPTNVIAIGRIVDLEMADGQRILISGISWFVTNKQGTHVWIVGQDIPYGIEYSSVGPFVTDHGIEG